MFNQVTGIDKSMCLNCGICKEVCGMGCFEENGSFDDCISCSICLDECPSGAIQTDEKSDSFIEGLR